MRKLRVLLIVFGFMLTFTAMTLSIDKMRESKVTIENLENNLAREKANHNSVKEDRKKSEDKVYELNSKVNELEIEVGALQQDLAVERENYNKTKLEDHSKSEVIENLTGEVDKLKKTRASIVDKQKKVEPQKAKPSEANEGGRKIDMRVTAYGADCIGCEGKTASGTDYTQGRTLACPPQYKFGTKISIPDLGSTYICEDRGGAIQGNTFDMFHGSSEAATASFGVKYVTGYIRE
ncbi:3D domain-containing protein [Bacillus sp. FSL M8-0063]|uniref:3D domain-containing protein n=1 Tax=Bacillus sp. FSL M8-0063 TaxID=2921566 RepID=UPI0030F89481